MNEQNLKPRPPLSEADKVQQEAFTYLNKWKKRAKIALDQAERRDDYEAAKNLRKKLAALEWLEGAAIKEMK